MLFYNIFSQLGVTHEALLACLAAAIIIVVSLVSHEVAHGLVALWNGDDTARRSGRLSLNPMVHFDPMGLLMMLLIGFGYARPVPVNPNNYKNRRCGDITVALAGVTTNLILAFFNALFYMLVVTYAPSEAQGSAMYYFVTFLKWLFYFGIGINVSLALFNILPLYPLDGYRFIAAFADENGRVLTWLRNNGRYILYAFIAIEYITSFVPQLEVFSPLYWYFTIFGNLIEGGFIAFWGLFI